MTHTITCPSGLTGVLRGMKVREERVLADRRLAKSGGQLDALLSACWEQTDPFQKLRTVIEQISLVV